MLHCSNYKTESRHKLVMDALPGYRDLWRRTVRRAFLHYEPAGAREGIEKPAFPGDQAAPAGQWHAARTGSGDLSAGGRSAGKTQREAGGEITVETHTAGRSAALPV